jgi:Fe-S oxidoreductase
MRDKEILEKIELCDDCFKCFDICDTYNITKNLLQSPNGRLKTVKKIFQNLKISEEERLGIYTCTLCGACNIECSQHLDIAGTIHHSKIKLWENHMGPLEVHNQIINGIMKTRNSVGGIPDKRLDWLPKERYEEEQFEAKDCDTLLFIGCMSSFKVKESATLSYEILKKANFNFKILKEEPCCGEYIYSSGNLDLSKKIFKENIEFFKKNNIKKIIVTCAGCLYAFDTVYRKYFQDFDLEVKHIVDLIYELEIEGKIKLKPLKRVLFYHDPCRLGRKYANGPLFNQPRELLKKCGIQLKELAIEPQKVPCCGAGSGVRGVDSKLCLRIGVNLIKKIDANEIASSCPLCVFNLRYINYKHKMGIESKYITDYIFESIEASKA